MTVYSVKEKIIIFVLHIGSVMHSCPPKIYYSLNNYCTSFFEGYRGAGIMSGWPYTVFTEFELCSESQILGYI